jgi:hypothetical protein
MEFKIDMSQTPEKFRHMKEELVPPLLEILRKLDEIEKKHYAISRELNKEREHVKAEGGSTDEVSRRHSKNWDDFAAARKEVVAEFVTEKCVVSSNSMSNPSEYFYISGESNPRVYFVMKTAKRAVVEFHYKRGLDKSHQFVWRNIDDVWKIDEKKYGYGGDKWSKGEF